jgi:polysaccharide biosynthesis/export protein
MSLSFSHGRVAALLLSAALCAWSQPAPQQPGQTQNPQQRPILAPPLPEAQNPALPQGNREPLVDPVRSNYTLGPNDQILIRAQEAEEISDKPFRIDTEGFVNLPLVGRLHAGGLTVQELEAELVKRLRQFIRQPQVIVTVVQFRSDPVFFVGAFRSPGIYPLQGRRTLVEMLTTVGGLQPNASRRIRLTRRTENGVIPLPNIEEAPDKKTSSVEISMGSLRENVNPAEDIVLQAYDVITVERAEMVYISGEVAKVGAIELGERDSISISQALTLSGGFGRDADRSKVIVLRPILTTNRRAEIEVDVNRIFEGKDNDFPLMPNDMLYVRRSYKRNALTYVGTLLAPSVPYLIFTFATK